MFANGLGYGFVTEWYAVLFRRDQAFAAR